MLESSPKFRFVRPALLAAGLLVLGCGIWFSGRIPVGERAQPASAPTTSSNRIRQSQDSAAALYREEGCFPRMPVDTSYVYVYCERMPEPPGGMKGLMHYLQHHIEYPAKAQRQQVEGRVLARFVVGRDGRIRDASITQSLGAGCDEEVLRAVRRMPPWTPGGQSGQAVKVWYTLPVTFRLR